MSIADNFIIIAEKQQAVYDKGIEQGRQAVYDEFWDEYLQNGNRTDFSYAFSGKVWNDDRVKPDRNIKPRNANNMFRQSSVVDLRNLNDVIDWSGNYGIVAVCRECSALKYVGKIGMANSSSSSAQELFHSCTNLISIDELMVGSSISTYSNAFYNCTALTDINISGTIAQTLSLQYSPLSKASIESIIGHLSGTATGKTLTLKKTAVNEAFSIDVDDTTTWPEGSEYYTLRHSRDNWTISYI